jgi:hypothetical protein
MKKIPLNRRELIKKSIAGTALLASAGIAACAKKDEAEAPNAESNAAAKTEGSSEQELDYISEDNQMAQSLGYKENASAVDSSVRVDKGDTPGSEQYCLNCQFYVEKEGVEGGGGCQLFPGKLVKAKGWCKSWALKAS